MPMQAEKAKSILEALCEDNQIKTSYVDTENTTNALRKKIYSIWPSTKKAITKGGRQGKAALEKLKSGTYKLKLSAYK